MQEVRFELTGREQPFNVQAQGLEIAEDSSRGNDENQGVKIIDAFDKKVSSGINRTKFSKLPKIENLSPQAQKQLIESQTLQNLISADGSRLSFDESNRLEISNTGRQESVPLSIRQGQQYQTVSSMEHSFESNSQTREVFRAMKTFKENSDPELDEIKKQCLQVMDEKFKKWLGTSMYSEVQYLRKKTLLQNPKLKLNSQLEYLLPQTQTAMEQHHDIHHKINPIIEGLSDKSSSEISLSISLKDESESNQEEEEPQKISFCVDDIDSLQDAEIDKKLLENHFLSPQNQECFKRQLLLKYARNFGYCLIPKDKLFNLKFTHEYEMKESYYRQRKHLNIQIKKLSNEVFLMKKKLALKDLAIQSKIQNMESDISLLKSKRAELQDQEQKQGNILQIEVSQKIDHKLFDITLSEYIYQSVYSRTMIRQQTIKRRTNKDQEIAQRRCRHQSPKNSSGNILSNLPSEEGEANQPKDNGLSIGNLGQSIKNAVVKNHDDHDDHNHQSMKIVKQNELQAKYTISCNGTFYQVWNISNLLACLYLSIMYPYFTVNELPDFSDFTSMNVWFLITAELVCFLDMVIHFLLQEADEEGISKQEPLIQVATKYFKGSFKQDLFIFVPWGLIFTSIDKRLRFFWVTKALRIVSLNYYLSDQMLIPIIKQVFDNMRERALSNPLHRDDINQDHIYNYEQIIFINGIKIFRQFLRILMIAYYIGQYWYIFAGVFLEFREQGLNELDDNTFLKYNGNWSFLDFSNQKRVLVTTYFSMTSLSTVGFGDYYPVSDNERLIGSFVLLFGVALFSLFMGQLLQMIERIQILDNDVNQEEELEKFFLLLRGQFNNGKPINSEMREKITNFMNLTWQNNRNNFLITETDLQLFDQLYPITKLAIYKDFIFKGFLYQFRRFFQFRFALVQKRQDVQGPQKQQQSIYQIVNPNLKKLQVKTRQMIFLMRQKNQKTTKMTMEESKQDVAKIRERLAQLEDKRIQKKEERKKQHSLKKKPYGLQSGPINFPFMTFENDDRYAEFMTQIMRSLEARFFIDHELIQKELNECLEVLFVVEGRYAIGYEINKITKYRRQFGPSTIIGGFNMCFQKRFFFNFIAQSNMVCYSIRRQQWIEIMDEFPDLYRIVKLKCFNFYYNQIYRPMIKQKMRDITKIDMRSDFNQVLAVTCDSFELLKGIIHDIFSEDEKKFKEQNLIQIENQKINWLLDKLQSKIDQVFQLFLDLTYKAEYHQNQLWNKVQQNIAQDKVKNPKQYIRKVQNVIYKGQWDNDQRLRIKRLYRFRVLLRSLKKSVQGGHCNFRIQKESSEQRDYVKALVGFFKKQIKSNVDMQIEREELFKMSKRMEKHQQSNRVSYRVDYQIDSDISNVDGESERRDNSVFFTRMHYIEQNLYRYVESNAIKMSGRNYLNDHSYDTADVARSQVTNQSQECLSEEDNNQLREMLNKGHGSAGENNLIVINQDMIEPQKNTKTTVESNKKLNKKQVKSYQNVNSVKIFNRNHLLDNDSAKNSEITYLRDQIRNKAQPPNKMDQQVLEIKVGDLGIIEDTKKKVVIDQAILGNINCENNNANNNRGLNQQPPSQNIDQYHNEQSGSKNTSTVIIHKVAQIKEIIQDVPRQFQTKFSSIEEEDKQVRMQQISHRMRGLQSDSDIFDKNNDIELSHREFEFSQEHLLKTKTKQPSRNQSLNFNSGYESQTSQTKINLNQHGITKEKVRNDKSAAKLKVNEKIKILIQDDNDDDDEKIE